MRRRWTIVGAGLLALLAATGVALRVRAAAADDAGARGMAHHANLRYDDALREYRRASQLDPSAWRWRYYRALLHLEKGEAANAAEALRGIVAVQPGFGLAWWRLGEAAFKQGRYDDADAAYARAQADPATARHARRGRERIAIGQAAWKGAYRPPRDPAIDALAEMSRSSVFLLRHAASLDPGSDAALRERIVRRALEVDPDNPDVVYEMGSLLQQLGRPQDAMPYFTRHLDMVEDDLQTLVQLGKSNTDVGRLHEAEQMLRRALAERDDAVAYFNLGVVMERRGRTAEAEDCYRRALGVDPTHASSHNNLAALLAESGRLAEAADHLTTVIRFHPEHVDAHANLGAALAQQGHLAEALKYLDRALQLDPDHGNARSNREAVAAARPRR